MWSHRNPTIGLIQYSRTVLSKLYYQSGGALSKCLSNWIKVIKWDYFQNDSQDFFFFYILIFIYFSKYETIVKSSAWSFGHADPDPSSVTEFPLKQDWNLYQFDSCFRVIIALRFNEIFSNISFYQIWEDGLEEHKYEFWQSFSRLYKSFFHIVHSTCFETSFFELKWY